MAAFVLLVISSTLARSGTGKAADERLRFGSRIVDAEAVVPPGRWVTDVADLETLVRIAESYERLVVHAAERGRDVYLVDDGVAVYRFSTPRWEPPAEAPTAILPAQSR
jgi:hypothetical protein